MNARFGRWWRRRSARDQAATDDAAAGGATGTVLDLDGASVVPVPVVAGEPTAVVSATLSGANASTASPMAASQIAASQLAAPDAGDGRMHVAPTEQPVLVPATSARVGVVLPAGRAGALLRHIPLPRVPKRTVFAVGLCAGLAAPLVGRQVAIQALTALIGGARAARPLARPLEGATVEIIRIHYASAAAGHAANAVTKILEQVRR